MEAFEKQLTDIVKKSEINDFNIQEGASIMVKLIEDMPAIVKAMNSGFEKNFNNCKNPYNLLFNIYLVSEFLNRFYKQKEMIVDFQKEVDRSLLQWIQGICSKCSEYSPLNMRVLEELYQVIKVWIQTLEMGFPYFDAVMLHNFRSQVYDKLYCFKFTSKMLQDGAEPQVYPHPRDMKICDQQEPWTMFPVQRYNDDYYDIMLQNEELFHLSDTSTKIDSKSDSLNTKVRNLERTDLSHLSPQELKEMASSLSEMETENAELLEDTMKTEIIMRNLLETFKADMELDEDREESVITFKKELDDKEQ
ncbi:unnamed protein product [Moneuplotes crassus]|uniref:Uncharacterized protein n=1 Tax=Euplotes crassus TaxID=5936 RepID=A0AAD1XLM5_EUPCR|nr:unnamed protein product [Moneuplotes crassus]